VKRKFAFYAVEALLFFLVLGFNACQAPSHFTENRLGNTSTAGNPMTPISNKTITALCSLITQCHEVVWSECESGLLATTGIAARLGVSELAADPFSVFRTAESSGQITGNSTALESCTQSVTALSCADSKVQNAYRPWDANPFANVTEMFSTSSGSCPDVARPTTPTNWTWTAFTDASGINFTSTHNAYDPQFTTFNSKLYSTWVENDNGYNVRVAVTDGTSAPLFVDGGTGNGLNVSGTQTADSPYLVEFSGKLYAMWVESTGGRLLVRAKVYNGNDSAPAWSTIDNGGLNRQATAAASTPEMMVFNSKLYAVWTEKNASVDQVRVAVYNGLDGTPSWSFVDGNLAAGLNFNSTQNASNPRLGVFGSALYATWSETSASGGIRRIRLARYGGDDSSPAWSFVDGGDARGRNFDPNQNAQNPSLAAFNSKLYLTWQEWNSPSSEQIRVAVYDGTSWSWADGGRSQGLNWDTGGDAQVPQLLATGSSLLVTWREQVSGVGHIRARSFNGNDTLPVWTFIDGNTAGGLNRAAADAIFSFKRNPQLVMLGTKLFLIWDEQNRIQLNSAVAN
jgi:hypothetical protein